jgi:hypothetical protein
MKVLLFNGASIDALDRKVTYVVSNLATSTTRGHTLTLTRAVRKVRGKAARRADKAARRRL